MVRKRNILSQMRSKQLSDKMLLRALHLSSIDAKCAADIAAELKVDIAKINVMLFDLLDQKKVATFWLGNHRYWHRTGSIDPSSFSVGDRVFAVGIYHSMFVVEVGPELGLASTPDRFEPEVYVDRAKCRKSLFTGVAS